MPDALVLFWPCSLELISQPFNNIFLSQQINISISSSRRNDQPNIGRFNAWIRQNWSMAPKDPRFR
jgi:hypothetical protein